MSTTLETDITEDRPPEEVDVPVLTAVLAEFKTVDDLLNAARAVRKAGYTVWDTHSPFPIHGIDRAQGIRPTALPWIVLCGGLFGLSFALWLQWFCNAHDYKFPISGKPFWSLPANIPVIFELTVLCSAFTSGLGMLALNRLPMLYNPLFKSNRFRRVTDDRFFVVIDASDPKFDASATPEMLKSLGAEAVETVED
jgi:Protein of unknown function (DUF3341)